MCKLEFGTIVSIGARLREERLRLGLNQRQFSAFAGAKEGAQLKWEKDQSSPTAGALAGLSEAGADVLYIITGRRSVSPANLQPTLSGSVGPDEIRERIEFWEAEVANISRKGGDPQYIHAHLTEIATSPDGSVEALFREQADNILRRYFSDPQAGERRQARIWAKVTAKERFAHDLLDVVMGMSLDINPAVERELTILMYNHGIEVNEIVPLLDAMRRAEAVVWQRGGSPA